MTRWKMHLMAVLLLCTLALLAFAIMNPFNVTDFDSWVFHYVGSRGLTNAVSAYALRPFNFGGAVIAQTLLPNLAQNIYVVHVAGMTVGAICLFYGLRWFLPNWFALWIAAAYLFYIPFNRHQLIALHFEVYSWTLALGMAAFMFWLQGCFHTGRWAWLSSLVGTILGYMAILSYESTFPPLVLLPFGVLLIQLRQRQPKRRFPISYQTGGMALLWWIGLGIAFVQFLIPYSRRDASTAYQNGFITVTNLSEFIVSLQAFLIQSFPLEILRTDWQHLPQSPYLLMGLAISVVAIIGVWWFWQQEPREPDLPSARTLLIMLGGGLIMTMAGGAVYAYGQLLIYRSHYFAAPAQTVVIIATLALILRVLQRALKIKPFVGIVIITIGYFTLGSSWYYLHQQEINATNTIDFSEHMVFFREMLALIPDTVPDTLIAYRCDRPNTDPYHSPISDIYAVRLLYQDRAALRSTDSTVFEAERVIPEMVYGNLIGPKFPSEYRYEQLIIISCEADGLVLLTELPPEIPGNAAAYNPQARIVEGLIQDWQARMLAR